MRTSGFAFLLCAACSASTETVGDDQQANFSYAACTVGCDMGRAMMVGTTERVVVDGSSKQIPPITIASSAPGVFEIASARRVCCDDSTNGAGCNFFPVEQACAAGDTSSILLDVNAVGTGSAELVLTQANGGATFDQVAITVAEPSTLALECDDNGTITPIPSTLISGETCPVAWTVKDSSGRELMASSGVALSSSDATVMGFESSPGSEVAASAEPSNATNPSSIVGVAAGTATLTAQARAASFSAALAVVHP
jgi:hypothetical protein